MKSDRLIIIDGSGYIFRAFYAVRHLSTSKGVPTNAVFGFANMLLKVLETEKPSRICITFDLPKPSFRKVRYPEYKANRDTPPPDLQPQFPLIHKMCDCLGILRLAQEGYEADDIIATLARQAVEKGMKVEVITADKDLMQLVTDDVTLFDTMKDKRIGRAEVKERFGVTPEQIVDLFGLMGDSSDNIPGVTGIGEKTAAELIGKFGSLEQLYERLDEISQPKRKEALRSEKENAFLSRELATVKNDMKLDLDWKALEYHGPRTEELQAFLQELEFTNLLKRFSMAPAANPAPAAGASPMAFEAVVDVGTLKKLLADLSKLPIVAVDTESTYASIQDGHLVGISLAGSVDKGWYIPLAHRADGQIPEDEARKLLKPFLEGDRPRKVGQDLKADIQRLRKWGVELGGIAGDTIVASYLIDPSATHTLDAMALRHLEHRNLTYEEVAGKGKKEIAFDEVTIEAATKYSGEDACVTFRLNEKFLPLLKERELTKLYDEVEVPLIPILADMEYRGILVDKAQLGAMEKDLARDMKGLEESIHELAGGAFNVNSPKQLSQVLFEKLKLPVIKKTKTGISTDESVLAKLAAEHAICAKILDFRELAKLRSTYVEGLLAQVHSETGRVHTSFNQTVAATGRLSSSNPNLQNIPVGHDRYDIRKVFIAPDGMELFSADYSQIELRLLASMSGDKTLSHAFNEGEDVHEFTARQIFGQQTVTPEQRRVAKTINFGVVYGQSAFGLSQTLGISPGQAKEFIEKYFARYSSVKGFLRQVVEECAKNGYVSTLLGRRRYFPDITAKNRMVREMAERAAINAPIQGSAADMIKVAMVNVSRRLVKEKLSSRLILTVHDELVFEAPLKEKAKLEAVVREEMETAMKISVPVRVDVGWGKNWRECG